MPGLWCLLAGVVRRSLTPINRRPIPIRVRYGYRVGASGDDRWSGVGRPQVRPRPRLR